jgi:hypothetical protein
VWTTHQGFPIAFHGPVHGSVHDARLHKYEPFKLFTHFKWERWLADLGYVGCSHTALPFKGKKVTEDQKGFNRHHRKLRSRVERTFAWLDKWRVLHYADHDKEFIGHAFRIILNVTFVEMSGRPLPYQDEGECAKMDRVTMPVDSSNMCWCRLGCEVPATVDPTVLADLPHFKENLRPTTKPPSKHRKATRA